MSVLDLFDSFQEVVNASPKMVEEARSRRKSFEAAFLAEPDVPEVIPSGSLARGTHKDPIHDVDLVVVFDPEEHPAWGSSGESAALALDDVRSRVNDLLGATNGTADRLVRLAKWRNHAVKCFLDDPDDPDAFTVDVMPALRHGDQLLVPEAISEKWIVCDPEYLIAEVRARHAAWGHYAGTVRMLKWWAAEQPVKIKSLVVEVLALDYLPTDRSRPAALREFFTRAEYAVRSGIVVEDPAGLCGPIQLDLDYDDLADRLDTASDLASQALVAQANNDVPRASRRWGAVFGDLFPLVAAAVGTGASDDGPRPVKDTPQG
ncbi:nucleotidyltransferase domain-containing protein [Plantibacter sp. YIM 135249]|uniref:nucleotidyltransferase domain-containing protein n=1 Tax=Plantibacter sp. YIM 135249 TaxID=3423918 RepID=UPI003D3258FA